jgi:hypothetical protein
MPLLPHNVESLRPPIQPITDRFRLWTHPLSKIRRSLIYLPLRHFLTFLPFITIVLILIYYLSLNEFHLPVFLYSRVTQLQTLPSIKDDLHPIILLMHTAATEFEVLSNEESHDLTSAAWTYRQKRGRHPPPGSTNGSPTLSPIIRLSLRNSGIRFMMI